MRRKKKTKLVVYTVLVGDKEALNDPLQLLGDRSATDLDLDFVCFTDDMSRTSPAWSFREMPKRLIPPERLSRLPKALPHTVFPDQPYSLYIDNTVAFKRLPNAADLALDTDAVLRAFRHPWRSCPLDEADVVVRNGLDEADRVAAQTRFYDGRRPLGDIHSLTAGTTLLRRHHDPRVRLFGEMWWEQILLFSARDQISLDLCAQEAGCPIDYFPGDKRNSDLIAWPALSTPRRIENSFDPDRYAWEHRRDPEARARPRAHYLAHGDQRKYTRLPAVFGYCCARAGSGLGEVVPPRRGLARILEWLLPEITGPSSMLFVGVQSAKGYAADPEELLAARQAAELYFRFGPPLNVVTAMVRDDEVGEPAPFRAAHGATGFRLAVVIGATPRHHANALAKFLPLIGRDGALLVQFGESLSPSQIQRMQAPLGSAYDLSIFHGGHIGGSNVIPSSVFLVRPAR